VTSRKTITLPRVTYVDRDRAPKRRAGDGHQHQGKSVELVEFFETALSLTIGSNFHPKTDTTISLSTSFLTIVINGFKVIFSYLSLEPQI
jgi:hypothetical protein